MHRDDAGHEDLMKEAVSLQPRIELGCPSRVELVTLGFNAMGWLFVYLGSDPMYRFDEVGRLRRAFVDGVLYRTNGATLSRLVRSSSRHAAETGTSSESTLLRRDLSPDELARFRQRTFGELDELVVGLALGNITRQFPADGRDLAQKFVKGLQTVLESTEFLAPAIVRR